MSSSYRGLSKKVCCTRTLHRGD